MANRKSGRSTLTTRPPTRVVQRIKEIAEQTTYFSANRLTADLLTAAIEQVDDQDEPPRTPALIARLRHQLRGVPAQETVVDTLADQVRVLTDTVTELARKVDTLTLRTPVHSARPDHGRRTPGRA